MKRVSAWLRHHHVAAYVTICAAALSLTAVSARGAEKPPIRIGVLASESGTAAAAGHDMVTAWKLYWAQHGDTVDGRKIQFTYYDTGSDPARALTVARQAVEQDHVQMIVGPYLANEGLAVAPYAIQHKIPFLEPTVSADDLTQRKVDKYVIRVAGWTSSQPTHPAGVWAYDKGYRTVVTIADAYAFGYENVGGFNQTFTDKGGKVLKQIWTPLGNTDYSPYLSQIEAAKPDVVFVEMVGADAVHFLQQWHAFGLKGKIPLIANETTTDQSNIRTLPPDVVDGIISVGHFAEGRNDPATQEFDANFAAKTGKLPSYMAAAFFTAAQWIDDAMLKVHGNVENTDAFLAAVRSVRLADSPFGPMHLDAYNNPVENIYMRQVETVTGPLAKYGKTWNVVLKTYPNVSQFWTFSPQQYLKQPVYSTTFQGIKTP
ncbi:MAG TPA: ABC transporter substrate-binding protein [Candidatus Dormibacteraeota bacterium]|nr:ABC transporter substrate-binding protein [Candidatus Dormibacteraeota bacterium]